jgi:hypothetical protein
MANKITWADKVALQEKPDVVAENKVTAADMNQIKTAVNGTIDTMPSNLVNGKAKGSIRSIYAYDETGKLLGEYAQAFGENTIASGIHSHAEGSGATASSTNSHAEGNITTASGDCSHAEGVYTIASGENQHVQGKYNISDTTSAHIVGNGTERNTRSNAHTLDWQGNAWFAGDVYTGSTSGTNKDDGSVKLPVVYSGTTAPTNDIGKNGDLYVLLDS